MPKIYPQELKDKVVQEFLTKDVTLQEVANKFNVSTTSASNWARMADPEAYSIATGRTRQLLQAQEIVDNTDRLSLTEIAEFVGVATATVLQWRDKGLLTVSTECVLCGGHTHTKYCKSCTTNKYDYYHRTYGLTHAQSINLPKACEICGVEQDKMHIDHDHSTGEYRGVLCNNCNTGLGKFGDSVERMYKAIEYLKEKGSGIS